jgi:hypothetical protein
VLDDLPVHKTKAVEEFLEQPPKVGPAASVGRQTMNGTVDELR